MFMLSLIQYVALMFYIGNITNINRLSKAYLVKKLFFILSIYHGTINQCLIMLYVIKFF